MGYRDIPFHFTDLSERKKSLTEIGMDSIMKIKKENKAGGGNKTQEPHCSYIKFIVVHDG